MRTRVLILIGFAFVLLACSAKLKQQQPAPEPAKSITQTRPLEDFQNLVVEGKLDVSLHTGYAKPQIILHGDKRDLQRLNIGKKGGALFVSLMPGYPQYGPVSVDIRAHHLSSFTYHGKGMVKGTQIHSKSLDLDIENPQKTILGGTINLRRLVIKGPGVVEISGIKSPYLETDISGNPQIKLAGVARISELNLMGTARFNLYWVFSDLLTIRAKGNSYIELAGVANKIDVELWNHARFNGRYLRASRAFVKTHGRSIAEISTVHVQHTLATDASDIRFYNLPTLKTDFMAYNGAVLDMRNLDLPFIQEYTVYNK